MQVIKYEMECNWFDIDMPMSQYTSISPARVSGQKLNNKSTFLLTDTVCVSKITSIRVRSFRAAKLDNPSFTCSCGDIHVKEVELAVFFTDTGCLFLFVRKLNVYYVKIKHSYNAILASCTA